VLLWDDNRIHLRESKLKMSDNHFEDQIHGGENK
jgi:hypothetical protein